MKALVAVATLLAGCASTPSCPDRPLELDNTLSGAEYIARARAWQAYAMCLEGPLELEAFPILEPVTTPWERGKELERQRREGAQLARVRPGKGRQTGQGPAVPVYACRRRLDVSGGKPLFHVEQCVRRTA